MALKRDLDSLNQPARKVPKHVQRWAAKYCDKRKEYDALTIAIDALTKQRSHLAAELAEMDYDATPAQRKETRAENARRSLSVRINEENEG